MADAAKKLARPEPDWAGDVDISGIWPPHAIGANAQSSITVGGSFSTGLQLSGIVERLTLNMRSGVVRARIRLGDGKVGFFLVLPSGAVTEVPGVFDAT